jgi:hypothetical protein
MKIIKTREYPADIYGRASGGNAAGVLIDSVIYRLEDEPPIGRNSLHFGGDGQR